jgi:hypothetical protein
MKLMLTKTPPEDIKQYILPVVYNALDAESSQVQVIEIFNFSNSGIVFLGTLSRYYSFFCTFN